MSNRSALFELVAGMSEEAAGAALATLGQKTAPAALTDTPDSNGAFGLLGVTNPGYAGQRFIFKKGADSLPPGSLARGTAEINEGLAQARYNTGSVMLPGLSAVECEQYDDESTGLPGFRVKFTGPNMDPTNIPNVTAVPPVVYHGFDLSTARGLTDLLNWLPVPSVGHNPDIHTN